MLTRKAFRVFNTLVVPLDGSELAERALPYAVRLAKECAGWCSFERPSDQQEEASRRETLDYLCQVEAQLKQQRPNLRVTLDVRVGDPAPGITMAEITCGADLVVMATHGRTGIRRAVLGSVAGAVLTPGSVPVLLVSPAAAAVSRTQRPTPGGMVGSR